MVAKLWEINVFLITKKFQANSLPQYVRQCGKEYTSNFMSALFCCTHQQAETYKLSPDDWVAPLSVVVHVVDYEKQGEEAFVSFNGIERVFYRRGDKFSLDRRYGSYLSYYAPGTLDYNAYCPLFQAICQKMKEME